MRCKSEISPSSDWDLTWVADFDLISYINDNDDATTISHPLQQVEEKGCAAAIEDNEMLELLDDFSLNHLDSNFVAELENTIDMNISLYNIAEPHESATRSQGSGSPSPMTILSKSLASTVENDSSNEAAQDKQETMTFCSHTVKSVATEDAANKLSLAGSKDANTTTDANAELTNASSLESNKVETSSVEQPNSSKTRKADNRRTHLMARSIHNPMVSQRTSRLEPLPADVAQQLQAAALVGVKPPRGSRMRVRCMAPIETAVTVAQDAAAALAASDQPKKKRLNIQEYLQRCRQNGDEMVSCKPPTPPVERPIEKAAAVAPPPIPLLFKMPQDDNATADEAPATASAYHQPPPSQSVLRDPSLEQIAVVSIGCNTTVSLPCSTAPQRAIVAEQQATGELLANINATIVKAQGRGNPNITARSTLLSNIQDVLIKKHLLLDAGSSVSGSTTPSTSTSTISTMHVDKENIMFVSRNRLKPVMHSIECQTDEVLQFAPLRRASDNRSRQNRDARSRSRQHRDGRNSSHQHRDGRSRSSQHRDGRSRSRQHRNGRSRSRQHRDGRSRSRQHRDGRSSSHQLRDERSSRRPSSSTSTVEVEQNWSGNRWTSRCTSLSSHASSGQSSSSPQSHYRHADDGSASGTGASPAFISGYPPRETHQQMQHRSQRQHRPYHGQHPQHRSQPYHYRHRGPQQRPTDY